MTRAETTRTRGLEPHRTTIIAPARVATVALFLAFSFSAGGAHALQHRWQFNLTPTEVPPEGSGSSASGQAWLYYETETDHLRVVVSWANLEADLTALHIHGPALPGHTSRTHLIDIISDESVIPSIPSITNLRTQVWEAPAIHLFEPHDGTHGHGGVPIGIPPEDTLAAMRSDEAYLLLHSDNNLFPGGELRGQLRLIPVPEPGGALLLALGLAALSLRRARTATARI